MADNVTGFVGLNATNARIGMLMADFKGLKDLEKIVDDTLRRLSLRDATQQNVAMVKGGSMSRADFDGWFAEVVRKELGKTLGIVRAKAIQRVPGGAARSATKTAISRRMYKNELGGNINILGNRKRISFKTRTYEPGTIRPRSVSERTRKLNEYYGPDRAFILRFLEYGTDVRTAKPAGPTGRGSRASYGNRGIIGARSFFGGAQADMEAAANALGTTLVNYVEKWVDKVFENK